MPYDSLQALPSRLRMLLPLRAQEIYREAFNAAWEQSVDTMSQSGPAAVEEAVSRTAWEAVRRMYHQDPATRRWRLIGGYT